MDERPSAAKPVLVGPHGLAGDLQLPPKARALVVFAHGSGSSRLSPRNVDVAQALNAMGLGTLLFDLLDPQEARDRHNVFDIELLGRRMVEAIEWVEDQPQLAGLSLGLFGASTGAAAALVAAAARPERVYAVVSRGGRPDLAATSLPHVAAPTLLIVGGADFEVLDLNQAALRRMKCESELAIVDGATHLFEEPGALDEVKRLAGDWFVSHLKH